MSSEKGKGQKDKINTGSKDNAIEKRKKKEKKEEKIKKETKDK